MNVFVFGSNRQGRHGLGAAKEAVENHGAIYGRAQGLQGNSYAIITKELRTNFPSVTLEEIKTGVENFLSFAANHRELTFDVSPIGCGLAGFKPEQIAPLFRKAPDNVNLPPIFLTYLPGKRKRV